MSHQSAEFIQQCVPYSHYKCTNCVQSRASAHTLAGSSPPIHRKVGNKITQTTNMCTLCHCCSGLYNLLSWEAISTAVGSSRYKLVCPVGIYMSNAANHSCGSNLPNFESVLRSFTASSLIQVARVFLYLKTLTK